MGTSCECNSSYSFVPMFRNFAYVFCMVWGWACGLDIIVRLFFVTFPYCELSHFSPFIYKQLVPLVSATPLTVLYRLLKLCTCFLPGLQEGGEEMGGWGERGCRCDINFTKVWSIFFMEVWKKRYISGIQTDQNFSGASCATKKT